MSTENNKTPAYECGPSRTGNQSAVTCKCGPDCKCGAACACTEEVGCGAACNCAE